MHWPRRSATLRSVLPGAGLGSRRAKLCRPGVAHPGRATARAGFPGYACDLDSVRRQRSRRGRAATAHIVVEFVLSKASPVLSHTPIYDSPLGGRVSTAWHTTQHFVERDSPEGHAAGSLWLSGDATPMRCVGKLTKTTSSQRAIAAAPPQDW